MKNITIKQCKQCGKDFEIYPPSRVGVTFFCSNSCANRHKALSQITQRKRLKCLNCSREFETWPCRNPKFCSKKCKGEYTQKKILVVCKYCGKEFHKRPSYLAQTKHHHFCSRKCYALARLKNMPRNRHTKALRGLLKRRGRIGTCEKCGFNVSAILNIHHVDNNPTNNRLSNLQVLCPNCHALEHYITRTYKINKKYKENGHEEIIPPD